MSRRGVEFQYRTAIFEGAYRAWSHLGGLQPSEIQSKSSKELDPVSHPIEIDGRMSPQSAERHRCGKREYPYEPLPRNGLAHPFVKAILGPWLGPNTDDEAIQIGLQTLRTWWQHRRKGENATAAKALSSEKMQTLVREYTRHFFQVAHCLFISDHEQLPRGLVASWKNFENEQYQRIQAEISQADGRQTNQQIAYAEGSSVARSGHEAQAAAVNMKGKCVPEKIDMPNLFKNANRRAIQTAHSTGGYKPDNAQSLGTSVRSNKSDSASTQGDSDTFPIVHCNFKGECCMVMKVRGITCAHCVKIVENVLKGCSGQKPAIEGLLDAAADQELESILLKIDKPSNAKRIASEASRNLSFVGYEAKAEDISIGEFGENVEQNQMKMLLTFAEMGRVTNYSIFNWDAPCGCPDNVVSRKGCSRHSQMHNMIFDAFLLRKVQMKEHMAGKMLTSIMPNSMPPSMSQSQNFEVIDHMQERANTMVTSFSRNLQRERPQTQNFEISYSSNRGDIMHDDDHQPLPLDHAHMLEDTEPLPLEANYLGTNNAYLGPRAPFEAPNPSHRNSLLGRNPTQVSNMHFRQPPVLFSVTTVHPGARGMSALSSTFDMNVEPNDHNWDQCHPMDQTNAYRRTWNLR